MVEVGPWRSSRGTEQVGGLQTSPQGPSSYTPARGDHGGPEHCQGLGCEGEGAGRASGRQAGEGPGWRGRLWGPAVEEDTECPFLFPALLCTLLS